jgi:hypothetical protein
MLTDFNHFCESCQRPDILISWVENFRHALSAVFESIFPSISHDDVVACQDFVLISHHIIIEPYRINIQYA